MDLEKLKQHIANFDINTFLASCISTIGALTTENLVQLLYVAVAITAQMWTLFLAKRRSNVKIQIDEQDLELKKLEVESQRFELETKKREYASDEESTNKQS